MLIILRCMFARASEAGGGYAGDMTPQLYLCEALGILMCIDMYIPLEKPNT